MFEAISVADESPDDRQHGQDHQRPQHHPRAFMRLAVSVWRGNSCPRSARLIVITVPISITAMGSVHCRASVLAAECHVHQPEHIERRDESGNHANQPIDRACAIGFPKNFVFRPEARERRDARDGERGNAHRHKRPRHVNPQPAHLSHVLLAADAVNHRTRREEQQALEERVRHQMEDARRERSHATRHEHIAKLRNGGVSQHFLDVGLRDADSRRKQGRERSNDRDHRHRHRRALEDRRRARHHINARRHHGRRMNQRRNWSRAFHGVRQPDIKWNLRRLTGSANHQAVGQSP